MWATVIRSYHEQVSQGTDRDKLIDDLLIVIGSMGIHF